MELNKSIIFPGIFVILFGFYLQFFGQLHLCVQID